MLHILRIQLIAIIMYWLLTSVTYRILISLYLSILTIPDFKKKCIKPPPPNLINDYFSSDVLSPTVTDTNGLHTTSTPRAPHNIFITSNGTGLNGHIENFHDTPTILPGNPALRLVTVMPPIAEDDNEGDDQHQKEEEEVLESVRDSIDRSARADCDIEERVQSTATTLNGILEDQNLV